MNRFTCLFLLLTSFVQSPLLGQSWQIVEKANMPEAVGNNAVTEGFINGVPYVYSFAGIDSTKNQAGIHLRSFRYNTVSDQWDTLPPLPDTLGKIAAGASRVGDIIYIIGGYHVFADDTELSSNKVHRFDIQNNVYLTDGQPIPVPIDDQVQVVWRDSLIYVVTGWSDTRNVPNVQIYDPINDNWLVGTPTSIQRDYPSFGASGAIVGDTIFYFGGATSFSNFSAQTTMRKGVINPDNPLRIDWSKFDPEPEQTAYRAAATAYDGQIYWIGGSEITYNYDGIAYSNNVPVPPANRILQFQPGNTSLSVQSLSLPMDLRGIATTAPKERFIAGGMVENQTVSNKTFRLEWNDDITAIEQVKKTVALTISPNPTSAFINLQSEAAAWQTISVEVWDGKGQLQFSKANIQLPHSIAAGQWAKGMYIVKLRNQAGQNLIRKVLLTD